MKKKAAPRTAGKLTKSVLDHAAKFQRRRMGVRWSDTAPPEIVKYVDEAIDAYLSGKLPGRTWSIAELHALVVAEWGEAAPGITTFKRTVAERAKQRSRG